MALTAACMIVLTISPQCVLCMSRASALVSMLRHSGAPTAAYPTMAAVEALAAVVCEPGARTTDPILRHALLSETGALGRPLFALFNHPASMPFGPSKLRLFKSTVQRLVFTGIYVQLCKHGTEFARPGMQDSFDRD